jgi:hypothetical protein
LDRNEKKQKEGIIGWDIRKSNIYNIVTKKACNCNMDAGFMFLCFPIGHLCLWVFPLEIDVFMFSH